MNLVDKSICIKTNLLVQAPRKTFKIISSEISSFKREELLK